MLVMFYELLKEREDIRRGWQNRFRYILIDEFQDINQIQYDTVRLLAAPQNNLLSWGMMTSPSTGSGEPNRRLC